MKFLILKLTAAIVFPVYAFASTEVSYFSCLVQESPKEDSEKETTEVYVKFAVEGLDVYKGNGELVEYPGADEDTGLLLVTPEELTDGSSPRMANLNGQGGVLRIDKYERTVRLFGDGDGYQFTDLVLWTSDDDEEAGDADLEGYVRDYGPAYGDEKSFKQFIDCKKSNKKL